MGTTQKHLRKIAAIIESAYGVYEAPDTLLPFVQASPKQSFAMIEDESIVGVATKDLPVQGVRKVDGNFETEADILACIPLLEAAFGANTAKVFTLPADKNTKTLSICALDEVKTNKYAGVFVNNFMLKSSAEGDLRITADLLSAIAETRDDTAFPTVSVNPGARLLHQHMSGSGYVRIGDHADALAAGDNYTNIKDIGFGINWNFALDYANSQTALTPLSGRPDVTLEITLADHSADTFIAARDAGTKLQLEALYYYSATGSLLIQIPNFIIEDVVISGDDKAKLELKTVVGRNGISTSYENANMAFNSAIKTTLINS